MSDIKIVLFILSLYVVGNCVGCSHTDSREKILGDWIGIHGEYEYSMTIYEDHKCNLSVKNIISGDEEIYEGIYSVDYNKRPIPFSVTKIKNKSHSLHTIIKFEDSGELVLAEFAPKWRLRPIVFEEHKTIRMKRKTRIDDK